MTDFEDLVLLCGGEPHQAAERIIAAGWRGPATVAEIEMAITSALAWQPSENGPSYCEVRDKVLAFYQTGSARR